MSDWIPPKLSDATLKALSNCGEDRVMHNSHAIPAVAIRWINTLAGGKADWIYAEAENHDEAGRLAAQEFADRLRKEANRLADWADRITDSMK